MATDHIIALLIAERDKLNQAIKALQDGAGQVRPAMIAAAETEPRKRRTMSLSARRRIAAAQRRRWAKIKAAK
jgi:hypothetical protein